MIYKSALVTAASGKLRGIVASHNRGGSYLRGLTIPTNPNTSQQQAVRNNLASLQAAYAALTTAQRTAWATYAVNSPQTNALGEQITLTGQQMFIRCNSLRLQAGVVAVTAAPTINGDIPLTAPVPTIAAAATTSSVVFTNTDSWATATGGYLLVYTSRTIPATVNSFKGPFRFAGKVTGAGTPPTSPAVITLPFVTGSTGQKTMHRFVALGADGRISPELLVVATVP